MSRVKTPLLSPSRSYNKMYCGFFFFKNMEIFDVPGLTLRHELKAGDLGRLIEFSWIYGHSDFDYPIAFEGYVATTFAEYVIDPKPRNRLWMVEDEQGLVGTIGVMDRGDSAQLRWFSGLERKQSRKLFVWSRNGIHPRKRFSKSVVIDVFWKRDCRCALQTERLPDNGRDRCWDWREELSWNSHGKVIPDLDR